MNIFFRRFQESLTISLPVSVVGKSVVACHQQVDRVDLRRLIRNNYHLSNNFLNKYLLPEYSVAVAATLLMLAAMLGKIFYSIQSFFIKYFLNIFGQNI